MTSMNRCGHCQGFVPAHLSDCPNCVRSGPRGRPKAAWLMFLGAGATAVTLAACYGAPPSDDLPPGGPGNSPKPMQLQPQGCRDAGAAGDAGSDDGGTDGGTDGGCS